LQRSDSKNAVMPNTRDGMVLQCCAIAGKHWIFRLSELTSTIAGKKATDPDPNLLESRYDPT
jgi:hypothetical protein